MDKGVAELDATYYDTVDTRLAAASITLRRRTGGSDAGWHLKFPVGPGVRDEIQAPSPTPCRAPSPGSSAPASGTPTWSPSSASAPPATYATSWTPTAGCSPRSASTPYAPSGSPRAAAPPSGPRSRWNSPTAATRPSSTRWRNDSAKRAYGHPHPPPNWRAPWPTRRPRRSGARRSRPPRPPRPPRPGPPGTMCWPICGPSGTRSSSSTRPSGGTCTTPCTACASPPAGCAAPSGRTAKSSTAPSPTRSATN